MTSLAPPPTTEAAPRVSAELLDSQAPTLTPPTANSSPRHEHATLPPEPSSEEPPQVAPEPTPAPPPAPAPNPTDVAVTFLLISGTRKSMHFAPSMTFGRVKEAFWGAWTSDGTLDKPPSPSFLRVLHMGKELSDGQTLADAKLPDVATLPAGTVVHISVRPFGPPADDDIVKSKRRSRRILGTSSSAEPATTSDDTHGRSGRCGCIIC